MSAWLLAACRYAEPADGVATATDSAGTPGDTTGSSTTSSTTAEPEPEPETAGSACGEPLAGQWGDCINGNAQACGNERAGCLTNSTTTPQWGTCILPCEDRCDCWAAVDSGSAEPACEPVLPMGERACVLSCADGQTCPDGMTCRALTGVVSVCAYDNTDFDPTGGPDPSGSSTGDDSTTRGAETDGSSSSGTTTTGG